MSVRSALKGLLEAALARSGIPALHRATRVKHSLVLAYHNVVPDDCAPFGDRSLHLPRRQFVRQLERLLATHTVVPLDDVLAPAAPRQRPRVAITFDDGYRGAVLIAVEELAQRGLPATLFVVPGFLGRGPYWWDAVASPAGGGIDPGLRTRALQDFAGKDAAIRRWLEREGRPLASVPEWARVASEDELRAAIRHPGIMLAPHTWSHPNLLRLSPPERAEELARPLRWLHERYARVVPWLSYPYGLANGAVAAAAAAAGYTAALSLSGGSFAPARVNRYAVPRLNVPSGLSPNGFVLRSSGLYAPQPS
ncbi:MAG TPA: polysaccharide deacetylase family protein [Gemmatimonadales bacterium]|nr:polysaccharide deacetylase family protein [Gemmatimonadales bacterium]